MCRHVWGASLDVQKESVGAIRNGTRVSGKPPNMSDLKKFSDSSRVREGFLSEVGTVVISQPG